MSAAKKNILIFGAASAIAQATAREFCINRPRMILVDMDEARLKAVAEDLNTRGAEVVHTIAADLTDFDGHAAIIKAVFEHFEAVDVALFAHGLMSDQKTAEQDYEAAERMFKVNFLSVVSLMTPLANAMEEKGRGSLVVISSPAGDRGRQSNYVYGASKGALSIFCQGLRNRLHPSGVQVLTVKPGFVDTPMTADLEKGPLYVQPEVIGKGIVKAIDKGRNEVYLPWFWCGIMAIIKAIPEFLFKRLKL